MRAISPTVARRMAIMAQRLAGPPLPATREGILQLVRALGCVQLDPISVVAPSHRLVLWSRLGPYPLQALEQLQWEERRLFEYWAHAASIVLTEDYPIHRRLMLDWSETQVHWSRGRRKFRDWVRENAALKTHVLRELRRKGPLPSRAFEDRSQRAWQSSGWTANRNVNRMLDYLWLAGVVVVSSRESGQRWWELAERWLPDWTPRKVMGSREIVRVAAQRSLRALGLGRTRDIERHFIPSRYPGLPAVLDELVRNGTILPVRVEQGSEQWPGTWYIHRDDLAMVDRLESGDWQPRTTLLSPFDNLIRDRERTRLLFGFDYSIEIYVPAAKRKYGYYVLPILHDDQLIGRIDPAVDRKQRRLTLRGIHAEDGPPVRGSGEPLAEAIASLATFVGADTVTVAGRAPAAWAKAFRTAF